MAVTYYAVMKLSDGTFGVKVVDTDGNSQLVTGFKDEPAAAAWAALQRYALKRRVSSE